MSSYVRAFWQINDDDDDDDDDNTLMPFASFLGLCLCWQHSFFVIGIGYSLLCCK